MDLSAEQSCGLVGSGDARQQLPNVATLPSLVASSSSSVMTLLHNAALPHRHTSNEKLYTNGDFMRGNSDRAREDDSATPSTSPSRSPSPSPSPPLRRTLLDKPLEQLTEEDIMHLTREDCRRYLKQKGMRRPSWNKSQAIQQVLSLKSLFDGKDDEEKSFRPLTCPKKLHAELSSMQEVNEKSREPLYSAQLATTAYLSQQPSPKIFVGTNSSKVSQRQERKDTYSPYQPEDLRQKNPLVKVPADTETVSRNPPAYRCTDHITAASLESKESYSSSQKVFSQRPLQASGLGAGMEQSAQLTIFYSGRVNVYDNVPEDKARAVMLLAERSSTMLGPLLMCLHPENATDVPVTVQGIMNASSKPVPLYAQNSVATTEVFSTTMCPSISSVPVAQSFKATQSEHQPSRKACLERYLEKRRCRYNSARSPCAPSSNMKRIDGGNVFSSQLISEAYKFNSYLEMVDPSLAVPHNHNLSQVQLPTQSRSASETSCSPHLQSCSSL